MDKKKRIYIYIFTTIVKRAKFLSLSGADNISSHLWMRHLNQGGKTLLQRLVVYYDIRINFFISVLYIIEKRLLVPFWELKIDLYK